MFAHLIAIVAAVWAWIRKASPIPIGDPTAVDPAGKLIAPLFYLDADGDTTSTWNFLVKAKAHRDAFYRFIAQIKDGNETPACAFLLSPNAESGLWKSCPSVLDDAGVASALVVLKELARQGVAAFATLYVDNPGGNIPCFWDIEKHVAGWSALHAKIGKYVSGYFLSIETNERGGSLGAVQHYIEIMRRSMPGAKVYGTHLQWATRTPYSWNSGGSTPSNADLILAESPWHISEDCPDEGNRQGADGMARWCDAMRRAGVDLGRVVAHEFNLRPGSPTSEAQRDAGRGAGLRGVGG